MARVLITGSADGLGLLAGRTLVEQGHRVVLHARSAERAAAITAALPKCEAVVVGDVSSMREMATVADQVNDLGRFDAVIHNVAVGNQEPHRIETVDGLSHVFAINVVAPYVLTALIERVHRLVYLGSGLHTGGDASLEDLQWEERPWNGAQAYADSKLHDVILAMAVYRLCPNVLVNAVDPGWVPTRMGGPGAPGDLTEGARTQAWLAVSDDPDARVTGQYLHHQKPGRLSPTANDHEVQDRLIAYLLDLAGVSII
jgi:NAD(P)-dependent dehydrogenase (short-subunit alcohol dehydrogenase family)